MRVSATLALALVACLAGAIGAPPVRAAASAGQPRVGEPGVRGPGVGATPVGSAGVAPMGRTLGIGLEAGAPTSLTLKYMWTSDTAVVLGAGSFGGPYWSTPTLSLSGDVVRHPHRLMRNQDFHISWYAGAGAWLVLGDRLRSLAPIWNDFVPVAYAALGARFPIGVQLTLERLPLEVYMQGVPAFFVVPGLSAWMGGSGGFRFYF